MGKEKKTIRTLGISSWPTKGQTSDNGIGSRAKASIAELPKEKNDATKIEGIDDLKKLHDKVVDLVKGLSQAEQRAVLLAAASDFTWDALIDKAKAGRTATTTTVDEESWERVKAVAGWEKMGPEKLIAAFSDAKEKVRAERAAKAETRKAAKGKA